MKCALGVSVLFSVLLLGASGPALSQPPCLDNPDYYCFSKCDYFWRYCVSGSNGCWMYWVFEQCDTDLNSNQCCVHTIRPGLF